MTIIGEQLKKVTALGSTLQNWCPDNPARYAFWAAALLVVLFWLVTASGIAGG
jgi:hypothetical protein